MGQAASAAGHPELRHNGSTKQQRNAKHRRSTRSLPDASLIRTTPANYQNGGRANIPPDSMNIPPSVSSSSMTSQQMSRRIGVSTNGGVGHAITANGANSSVSCAPPAISEQNGRDQESMMKKYMHRDAAPYYVSTKTKSSFGPRSLDINLSRPWVENGQKYKKSTAKTRYDEAVAGSSNWSDVASDMFRITKHHDDNVDKISDVQSDFVSPNDRYAHRHNRASSRRCQQKKSRRPDTKGQEQQGMVVPERRQARLESGEPDGEAGGGRFNYRDCSGLMMTPVPENPYKEQIEVAMRKEDDEKADRRRENISTKRSKSVQDCASTKRGQLQPPSHPPPRPPKGKLHYYARLESDASGRTSAARANGSLVEHWIDFPQHGPNNGEASPNRSASTDTPTPRSPGSSECDKLVIQSLRAELSAERSLRVDAERRVKNYEKEAEANRQRMRQLESDVQMLSEALNELKLQREEEAAASKRKMDELSEKCRQMGDDLRRTVEEKRQTELRSNQEKSSYDEYMDNVANQVGQALARQETLKTECARLQKRVLEVEWENKVLKAQLRLTPMLAGNSNGLANGNCYSTIPSSAGSTATSSVVVGKTDFARFALSNAIDNQNNNGNHAAGVVYRRKSFREKMAGLHRYRQSMGSDPTLDQSGGAGNMDAVPIVSIESLASFNEENEHFASFDDPITTSGTQGSLNGRRPYHQGSSFLMLNGGEGLCSRPSSFSFDPATLSARNGQSSQTNGPPSQLPHHRFPNGDPSHGSAVGGHRFNKMFDSSDHDDTGEDDERVKNYAAMFSEEGFLSSLPAVPHRLPAQVPNISTIMSTPIFRTDATDQGTLGRNTGREINDSHDSSTETLNDGSNLQANGGFLADSPKRKLDVVVNMLTSIEMRQPFSPRLWFSEKGQDKKCQLRPPLGLLRDDGYSTMSSELYAVFDGSLLTRLKSSRNSIVFPNVADGAKTNQSKTENYTPTFVRSLSDGQLNERNRLEQRILKRNQPSLNLDTFERDYASLLSASADGEGEGDGMIDGHDQLVTSNREALCELDIGTCIPSLEIDEKYLLSLNPTKVCNESKKDVNAGSSESFPPDPPSAPFTKGMEATSSNRQPSPVERQRPVVKPRQRRKPSRPIRPSNSDDTSETEDSDGESGTVIEISRHGRRVSKLANASTSSTSTSFTSDEDDSRFYIDEGAKATMQLWLKQLKIKRAGQKSGLVRYMPPECRPSILRTGVFARFGAEERRALASFDFLRYAEQLPPPVVTRKTRSRSITDLYENLPYHERTGTMNGGGGPFFNRSRCSSRVSFSGCGSLTTLASITGGERGMVAGRSYCSSLFLSDICNDDANCSSSTSNSSLSFTFQ